MSLLEPMAAYTARPAGFFFPCDYHWNGFGNAVAAEILWRSLGPTFYALDLEVSP